MVSMQLPGVGCGDVDDFDDLYSHHAAALLTFIHHFIQPRGNKQDAENLLQEVFLKLYLQDVHDRAACRAWLYRVATNHCINFLKRKGLEHKLFALTCRRHRVEDEVELDNLADLVGDDGNLAERLGQYELARTVLRALGPLDRAVLLLYEWGGFSHAEIAQMCSLPSPAASKVRLGRVREKRDKIWVAERQRARGGSHGHD
jgi:RNA polymerase sigma-70 factor (ECF subfamily)